VKIGITLPQAESDSGVVPRYPDIRAAALRAESDGFDSIWIMDHLLFEQPGQPRRGVWEGVSVLSALAEATNRVELGALVLCTAFRNPGLLAKMADAIDEISGGRLILGLGAGWHEPEFTAFGYPFDHLASRFEEAMSIIVPLVRTGAVDFRGVYENAPNCVNIPRGPRSAGPPILTGTQGPRLMKLTAEVANAWNACWLGRASELPEKVAPMLTACDEVGRDPKTLDLTVGQIVSFAGLDGQVESPGGTERFAFNDPDDLAAEWRAYAEQDVRHMIIWPMPESDECIARITRALSLYRDGSQA
jgi:alkanesulfonate monooxygenase SsuD/methylene tetrahydromethanopterin reductase-like flavin-dependent oxidoreductase (luciferase family)